MKKLTPIFIILILAFSLLGTYHYVEAGNSNWQVMPARQDKFDASTTSALGQLQSDQMLTVIVTLNKQTDLSRIAGADRAARLQGVIQALQATANATQGQLRNFLDSQESQGLVQDYTPLWIFNGISVTATAGVINALAVRPDVYSITSDQLPITSTSYGMPEANISLINAPSLWDMGYTGQGVVVASMDTGVDVSHPDLSARWRGGSNSWYDPYGQHPSTPMDLIGHGTQTMGIMVGGDAGGTSIGVAPGAQWIAVKMFNDSGNSTATGIHLGYQWLLDPDNNPATADAPNVVNNSWAYGSQGCYLDFEPDLAALRAAGILPVFAAGNGGPLADTSYSPANNPSAFAVGAVDNNDQIYNLSSRGPSSCNNSRDPFPDMVAPGVSVRTTERFGLYNNETGTSLAAPHVAGGLALLLSAYPNLDAGMQEQSLINTAVDLGASGPDEVFGYGRLDLVSALNWAGTAPTSTPLPTFTPSSTPTATPSPTSVPYINLALNQPVTVSSFQDSAHDGSMAVDGDLLTLWQTSKVKGKNGPSSEWIEVDLGSSQSVSKVVLEWSTYYATNYTIQTSSDQTSWSSVFNTSNENGGTDTITFNTVQARYVRLNSSAWNSNSYRIWLKEFEVYAVDSTPSPTPTDTAEPTATSLPASTNTSTPTPIGTGGSIHVGDLDAAPVNNGSRWNAVVYITVHDSSHTPVQGVSVSGAWSNGTTGSGSCTTDVDGICSISRNNLKNGVGSVSFSVTDLSYGLPYQLSDNHDPDGDSDGTVIIVTKP